MSGYGLEGKVVLITGGARGFGAEFARAFAGNGAIAVIGDIREDAGTEAAKDISKDGGACHFIAHDVRSDESWHQVINGAVAQHGGLDILINNAGIEISELLVDTDPDACRNLFDVNILGTMLGIKHAFRVMRPGGGAGKGGAVLNLSSVAGVTSTPGLSAYSASKSGVISLTEVATVESGRFGYGVRVNCLCPSLFDTHMGRKLLNDFPALGLGESPETVKADLIDRIPLGRFGQLSDIANAALYLCSDNAAFITGVSLPVDGGMSAA
jgi:3alpha(or 20beta)-hydroxysteroid dehydrogenase